MARLSATTAATASPTQVARSSGSGSCGADFMPLRCASIGHPGIAVRRQVLAGEDAQHARHLQRLAGVDPDDPRVRVRAAHEGHVHHARQHRCRRRTGRGPRPASCAFGRGTDLPM